MLCLFLKYSFIKSKTNYYCPICQDLIFLCWTDLLCWLNNISGCLLWQITGLMSLERLSCPVAVGQNSHSLDWSSIPKEQHQQLNLVVSVRSLWLWFHPLAVGDWFVTRWGASVCVCCMWQAHSKWVFFTKEIQLKSDTDFF